MAVQVTQSLRDPDTKNREIRGLREAMRDYTLKTGYIITENERETITSEEGNIHVIPAYDLDITVKRIQEEEQIQKQFIPELTGNR